MKKILAVWMTAALLASAYVCAAAQEKGLAPGAAVTKDYAQLLETPEDDAAARMNYYPGVRVEVLEMDGDYAFVQVGAQGGRMEGYMRTDMLAGGEESVRSVMPVMVRMNAERQVRTYGACDPAAEREGKAISLSSAYVLGVCDEWLHVNLDLMGNDSAFVRMDGANLSLIQEDPMNYTCTRPMEDELSFEDAVAQARELILQYGRLGSGMNVQGVTEQTLERCSADVVAYYYPALRPSLLYDVTFYKAKDMEGPDIHAWISLWIDGMEIDSHNFGNG